MDGVADYTFVRELETGGQGSYFLAIPPARLALDAEHVSVKLLRGANNADGLRRATRELRAFAATRSEHLVRLLDAGRDGDYFFYSMNYCAGGSLTSPAQPLDRRRVLTAVSEAARGAAALHDASLVHRAIKPSNVLLFHDGARLADLGLAQAFQPGQTMTALGMITDVEYVDPLLLAGETATTANDIWSLGITLHRALTGVGVYGPMPEDDPLLCVRKVLSKRPVLSDALVPTDAAIIARCLDSSLTDRVRTALEVAETLAASATSAD